MSGGAEDPKNTTTTTSQTYSPEETAARNQIFSAGKTAYDQQQALLNASGNPAAVPVGPSGATTQAQGMYQNWASGQGQASADQMGNAVNYGLNGAMDVNNNTHLQGAIDAAVQGTTRNYTDPNGVLANIRSDAVGSGQYGGTRQGLGEGIAAGRYANEVGNIASTMSSAAYDKGQDTFARTLALAPGAMQASLMPAQAMSAVGAQQEVYGQQQSEYDAAGRAFELNKPFAGVQNYANLINGISSPGTVATNSSGNSGGGAGGQAKNAIMGGVGGAAAGAMIGAEIGAVGGPMGMAVGAGLGILMGLF